MDFDSLMAAELSKPAPKKAVRRAEIEAERRAAYEAEQKALEEKREATRAAKRKAEEDAESDKREREEKRARLAEVSRKRREEEEKEEERKRRKRLGLPELKEEVAEEPLGEDEEDVSEEELVEKLRMLGEPVMLFGEGHADRVRRYRRLGTVVTNGPVPTTLELLEEKDMKVSGKMPEDKEGRRYLYRQLASYFTLVLSEYEKAMEEEKRDTMTSRSAYNAMVQTRENMKPLFRKFERDDLNPSLLSPISEIVQAAQERRYVDANDGYLRLSIGKAAWPIGVTMVGIHARSAREKLQGGEKGHVMGDEVTRKFLQGIKRCITFAQVRWPPTDITQLMG